MNIFYEEDGYFKVASIMSETGGALQIESQSGKRSKLKASNVLIRFEGDTSRFIELAHAEAGSLEIDFMWECCGENEFAPVLLHVTPHSYTHSAPRRFLRELRRAW